MGLLMPSYHIAARLIGTMRGTKVVSQNGVVHSMGFQA